MPKENRYFLFPKLDEGVSFFLFGNSKSGRDENAFFSNHIKQRKYDLSNKRRWTLVYRIRTYLISVGVGKHFFFQNETDNEVISFVTNRLKIDEKNACALNIIHIYKSLGYKYDDISMGLFNILAT